MGKRYMPRKAKMFLDEMEIKVPDLAKEMGLSKGTLYKKLRAELPIQLTEAKFILDRINSEMEDSLTLDELFFYDQVTKNDKKVV